MLVSIGYLPKTSWTPSFVRARESIEHKNHHFTLRRELIQAYPQWEQLLRAAPFPSHSTLQRPAKSSFLHIFNESLVMGLEKIMVE